MYSEKQRSNLWYLLPIFLGIIGGVIAYFILRKDSPKMARNCLIVGLILAVIGIVMNIMLASQIGIEDNIGVNV